MKGALIVVLLGPGEREAFRLNDLLASLLFFEEVFVARSALLVVNDRNSHFEEATIHSRVAFKKVMVIDNPYTQIGGGRLVYDRMTAGLLGALQTAVEIEGCEFVLKLDTDALVCGLFSQKIVDFFKAHPACGMIGSFQHNPDGSLRNSREWWARWIYGTCGLFPKHWARLQIKSLLRLNPILEVSRWYKRNRIMRRALRSGWTCGDNILGGAYALSPRAVNELRAMRHLFNDRFLFNGTRVPEDVVVSMLVAAVGLNLNEYNRPGEVFAVWYQKPVLSILTLIERRYGLVHSIKADDPTEEANLRVHLAEIAQIPPEFRVQMNAFGSSRGA